MSMGNFFGPGISAYGFFLEDLNFEMDLSYSVAFIEYMSMLCYIEKPVQYRGGKDEIIAIIKEVLKDEPYICDKICEWVEHLYVTGQKIADWDINHFKLIHNADNLWTDEEREQFRELHDKIRNCTDENEKKKYWEEIKGMERKKMFEITGKKMLYVDKLKEFCKSNQKYDYIVREYNW